MAVERVYDNDRCVRKWSAGFQLCFDGMFSLFEEEWSRSDSVEIRIWVCAVWGIILVTLEKEAEVVLYHHLENISKGTILNATQFYALQQLEYSDRHAERL
jgi:hypothetical protein